MFSWVHDVNEPDGSKDEEEDVKHHELVSTQGACPLEVAFDEVHRFYLRHFRWVSQYRKMPTRYMRQIIPTALNCGLMIPRIEFQFR